MKLIECIIFEPPVAKGRARSTVIKGHVREYTPAKTRNSEAMIKALIRTEILKLGSFAAGIPLRVDATFFREKPKSAPKRVTMPVSKPDLDNYFKLLADALNKYVFPDDNQIVTMNIKKRFGVPPRIEVKIREETEG
jgi:Holliday junction resolvase RusA-like endonuclease